MQLGINARVRVYARPMSVNHDFAPLFRRFPHGSNIVSQSAVSLECRHVSDNRLSTNGRSDSSED